MRANTERPMYLRGFRPPRIGWSVGRAGAMAGLGDDYFDPGYINPDTGAVDPSFVLDTNPIAIDSLPLDMIAPPSIDPLAPFTDFSLPDFSLPATPFNIPGTAPTPLESLGFSSSDEALINQAVQKGLLDSNDFQNIISGKLSTQVIKNALDASGASSSAGSPTASQDLSVAAQMIKSATLLAEAASSPTTKPATASQPGSVQPTSAGSARRINVASASGPSAAVQSIEKALTAQSIPGVPNYALVGGGFVLLMLLGRSSAPARRSRRAA